MNAEKQNIKVELETDMHGLMVGRQVLLKR
jgi:hypothetical protein